MKKESVVLLNQLLINMQKIADELDKSFNKQDFEGVLKAKKELLALQKKVGEML